MPSPCRLLGHPNGVHANSSKLVIHTYSIVGVFTFFLGSFSQCSDFEFWEINNGSFSPISDVEMLGNEL